MTPQERDEFIASLREMAKAAERVDAQGRARAQRYRGWAQWLVEHPEADPAEVSLGFDSEGNVVNTAEGNAMESPR